MQELKFEISGLLSTPISFSTSDLAISNDLDKEVDQAAARYGFFAVASERAEQRLSRWKMEFEIWQAKLTTLKNADQFAATLKPLTKDQMDAHIKTQPAYKKFQETQLRYELELGFLQKAAVALLEKAKLVQTKCANRRRESQTTL